MSDFVVAGKFVDDLVARRGLSGGGFNSCRFLELFGASFVPVQHYEPDARTFRGEYYYNSSLNRLYKKIVSSRDGSTGLVSAHWQGVSD